jgi:ABC-type branched-subunit amino acid transport system ATPase component
MRRHINTEFADHTILAIMHKMEGVVEDMDEVIVLSQGQIACRGRPGDILADAHAQKYIPLD